MFSRGTFRLPSVWTFDPSFLPKLRPCVGRVVAHGRRPPGGRPRAVARRSRARPQAAARPAVGAAARPGSGQQG
eukprot:scaffold142_cov45-Phaeocystis_antarctica.AAC.1